MTRVTARGRASRLIIAMVLAVSAGLWGAGAAFATSSVTVDKVEGLSPAGQMVNVKGSGFLPGIQLYLVTCNPAVPSGGACDMANFGLIDVGADGSWTHKLKIVAKFGTVNCLNTACAVQTSRVGEGKDRTQEAVAPVSFTGQTVPAWIPPAGPVASATPTTTDSPATSPEATDTPAASVAPVAPDTTNTASSTESSGGATIWIVIAAIAALAVAGGVVLAKRKTVADKSNP